MPEEQIDPGAALAIKLLDNMLGNGPTPEMKALGEGVKANLTISCRNNINITQHIKDENVHTAKGIVFQKGVLKWFLGSIFITSMLVTYVPDIVKWFIGLL